MSAGCSALVWRIRDADPGSAVDRQRARALRIPIVDRTPAADFFIARDDRSLVLHHADARANDSGVRCALACPAELAGRRAGGRQSPMARAFGLHRHPPMRVLDSTAGLGRDAATLAGLGCPVTTIERQPALYALLADATEAMEAAAEQPAWWPNWAMPIHADAGEWLAGNASRPAFEAIYIDPMFASPRRKSRPQKALAWLAEIAGPDADAATLVTVARRHATRRVVVKQHARAEPLAPPPDLQISGRAIRFDIYLTG